MHRTLRTRRGAAVGIAGAVVASGLATAATHPAAATSTTDGSCRLVRLAEPGWGYDGGVMDIEVVDGRSVYYGSTYRRDKHGVEHQRALVWRGLEARPVRVGPEGWDADIAMELTGSGLVNGISEDWETGATASWVQDLDSMAITYLDTDSGPRGAEHGLAWIRRINDVGAAAGVVARNDADPWTDAVGFDAPDAAMELLPGSAEAADAMAWGINNAGQRAGYVSTRPVPEAPEWFYFDPVVWQADGTMTPLATPYGEEGAPRAIKDDGSVSGSMLVGDSIHTAHVEPAYWPSPDRAVGLGVLPGGDFGDVFGMDEGGWLVGAMSRWVKPHHRLGEGGVMDHAFLWTPATTEGTVRVLPSLYAVAKGEDDWHTWAGTAVHAVNRDLRQAGSGSHVEFRYGRPVTAPTIWLEADRCGREVATTHDPYRFQVASGRRATERAVRGVARSVRTWKRAVLR